MFYCAGAKTSKTPYETTLLAILRQVAYDDATGTVPTTILEAYKKVSTRSDDLKPFRFSPYKYQEILGGILKSGIRLRIMIDALDQCDKPTELLKVLRDAATQYPDQIELLVTSQGYVQVEKKLSDIVIVDVNTSIPGDDMLTYVTTEVKGRERMMKGF